MPIDDATWALVRADYVGSTETVYAICARYGIKHQELYARRGAENWPLRDSVKSQRLRATTLEKKRKSAATNPLIDPPLTTRATRAALIWRLYRAIDLKLQQMENLMTTDAETSSTDHERQTRAITGLVRTFERVTELQADPTKPAGKLANRSTRASRANSAANASAHATSAIGGTAGSPASPAASTADAERLRRDIAERLVRIHEQRTTPRDVG
jgi:hypothetical protein